ncbi:MAG: ATP-binding protein, partial [Chromatiales bacterium]|nr:ATP-binding protein [Chromatiales bacterium]
MLPKKLTHSGFNFNESESNLKFKFGILNSILLIAGIFSFLFGLLSDLGINDLGPIHSKVNYLFSITCITLIVLLRRSKDFFEHAATIFIIASLITFTSALIFVTNDEFRLIWFYFIIYVSYILLGVRAGMAMTAAIIISIVVCANLFDLNLSQNSIFTAAIGFIVASLLNRSYTIQMSTNVSRLDNALSKANQASEAKSLFLANISHEIRTPLNGMLGMAQVIQKTQLDDEQKHYIETFEHSGNALKFLIDEILDLSKIESGTLAFESKPFDSFRWMMDIQMINEPLFEESPVLFTTDVSNDIPAFLLGDRTRLIQIAINLISNAAKFTHQGEVKLTVGGSASDSDHFRLHISVEDSGIGIPPERLKEIFNSFQQLSANNIANRGVGLGLAISDRLVSAMGGKLHVKSTEGEGSHFWFDIILPIAEENKESSTTALQTENNQPLNILLVDDDAINRLAASMLLKQNGHHVELAIDGVDALEKLKVATFD